MIKVDETDPVGEMAPSFPFRDVNIKRGVDVKEFYDLEGEIGRGKFGTVYKCREKGSHLTLAAKFVGIARRQDRRNVEREVEIMRTLQHPRLIQLYDAFETDNVMCVVLELIEGGELFERVIDDDFVLTEKACTVFMRQICEGVDFIHANNIIHLDLKPENILCLTKTGNRIKIIDFGLARKYEPDKKLQVLFGTPEFVAPEVVNFDQISTATDMWSVGVICYVLLSGLSPFMGETDVETMANVTVARYDFEDESFEEISSDAKDFISKLLLKEKEARLTAVECLSHPWLRRKIPPPPPSLDNTKENLRNYVDKCVPILKNSIIIEDGLKEKPGVIEKIIENEQQKIIYPNLTSSPKKEISLLTNPKLQELFDYNKDNAQFMNSINQTFKENEDIINDKESDGIAKTQNIHEINIKNKGNLSPTLVKKSPISNQIINRNSNVKNDITVCSWNAKEKSDDINHVSNELSAVKGMISEKDLSKNNPLSNKEFIEKSTFNNKSIKSEILINENKMFETKPQKPEQAKGNIELSTNFNIVSSVGSNYAEPIQGPSSIHGNQQNIGKLITNEKQINEESVVSHSLWKRQDESSWFKKSANLNLLPPTSISTQITKDNIPKTLNNYKQEDSCKLIDFSKVSDFIRRSSIKLTENDKIPHLNLTETLKEVSRIKEVEPLPFKHHLRSNPPWFSELNNQHHKNPIMDRSERRSSDFTCFLNSKDDSASLNLADEIRKLSAKLLQMSNNQNQNVGNYTTNPQTTRVRNDPIKCFLENHGISHPRPKYKFSNLNRDVPIGSPPPPSNITYYLSMGSNVDRKDSHSDPGSPRTSPERTDTSRNLKLQTNSDTSSLNIKRESFEHINVPRNVITKAETNNDQLNKANEK